jgi:uncharacterized membrane protein YraQ (UPF0718 family)/copper chaperone CopZ
MWSHAVDFLSEFGGIVMEMSPYLMLGFFFAGLLHIFFPKKKVYHYMGGQNTRSVVNASLFGIPLPLCSCGVIPTGMSFYKQGASKGSTVSFLISTPQTGVDSVLVTYSLLGLPFALIRPVVALATGVAGGLATNAVHKKEPLHARPDKTSGSDRKGSVVSRVREMFRYAFVEFLQDISNWLIIGLVIAAAISVIIPTDFFASYHGNDLLGKFIILLAAIPIYVCATASVPIAAVLLLKGISPGAALVFLMAGPATNAATITMITRVMGKKSLYAYLGTIITGALLFGTIIDLWLPPDWFAIGSNGMSGIHQHELLPGWLKIGSSVALGVLVLNGYIQKWFHEKKYHQSKTETIRIDMKTATISVKGMTCNHCKVNVETAIEQVDGVDDVQADLSNGKVTISGARIDLDKIKAQVEGIGYEYRGIS